MSDKPQRSELNYLVAGALLLLGGGWIVNFSQDEEVVVGVIVGAVLLVIGLFLIGKGVLRGRR